MEALERADNDISERKMDELQKAKDDSKLWEAIGAIAFVLAAGALVIATAGSGAALVTGYVT